MYLPCVAQCSRSSYTSHATLQDDGKLSLILFTLHYRMNPIYLAWRSSNCRRDISSRAFSSKRVSLTTSFTRAFTITLFARSAKAKVDTVSSTDLSIGATVAITTV